MRCAGQLLRPAVLLAVLVLAGCAEDTSPQGICNRQSYDDPTVKDLLTLNAGSPWLQERNQDELKLARRSAVTKCLQARGVLRPGGVEQVTPAR